MTSVETIGSRAGGCETPGVSTVNTETAAAADDGAVEKDDESDDEGDDDAFQKARPAASISQYLISELTRGYFLEHDEAKYEEKSKRVYTFMRIPREMEKFMMFGFIQCTDAFSFLFTFLPPRFLMAVLRLFTHPCGIFQCGSQRVMEPAQICDLLKGIILIACCFAMNYVDTSVMYHIIRGQAIIKLYIFFNMLEIADRLFASFGQDILDSLFWTATEQQHRKREHWGVIPLLFIAIIYVFLHSMLVLFQATTLNVAFNSHNKALLTIMMSNNFVEIKGSVFKKFAKDNLFQMSCSDVRERFHYIVLLCIVVVRNMTEFNWDLDHLWQLIPDILMVLLSEILVDWLKHAFIVKFNNLSADVYREYTISLAYDTACSRMKKAFSDHSDLVSRRMGFTPLPLAVLLIRIFTQSLKISGWLGILLLFVGYLCLLTFKILNSIVMLGKTCNYLNEYFEEREKKGHEKDKEEKRERTATSEMMNLRRFSVSLPRQNIKRKTHRRRNSDVGTPPKPKHNHPTGATTPPSKSEGASPQMAMRQPSLSSKPILSNSTLSLMGHVLTEEKQKEVEKQCDQVIKERKISAHKRERSKSGGEEIIEELEDNKPPLADVDRFSMCSNRIV
ncbi:transmembrane anterior posterior transformation protein 1 homolog [Tubulanus polymorphus]|uniref:transmembrane anterior posterior transformation protein 1 homolog n=1 Tax=Tubulanus polymorphus TaxID=672921 RepID=UPI003DA270EE